MVIQSHLAVFSALLLTLLTACNSAPVRKESYAPPVPAKVVYQAPAITGSLYSSDRRMVLFEDVRARNVGDVLTINLAENTNASKSASLSTQRNTVANITNPVVLGVSPDFSVPGSNQRGNLSGTLNSSNTTSGSGDTAQSNTLNGTISVTVYEVMGNGYLKVRGEKLLGINQGHEYLRIEGIVRPEDIAFDNSVVSTRVANVLIDYGGEGPAADASRMGWLARFFIGSVFPF